MNKEEVLKLYEMSGGILKGHFILSSGRHAAQYMQSAKIFERPMFSDKICTALAHKVKQTGIIADVCASPAVGGILMGYEMSRCLDITNIFFEKRAEGGFELRRGFSITKGQKVLVAEDVITTGGSVQKVVDEIRNLGGEVVGICSIVDRSGGKAEFDVPYVSLIELDVQSYDAADCPLCKAGQIPAIKPGSTVK